jgi:hypothetical protein
MLDAGIYRARAIEAALGETDTGKEQVAVRFELLDVEGQQITWYGYFTDKTLETTFKALRTAGWRGQDLSDLSDLCGQDTPEVNLVVEHETDQQGKVRARVRWVNGTGGLALKKALDANKAKAFAARMKGKLVAYDRTAGSPKPPPKQANGHDDGEFDPDRLEQRGQSEGRDDEIPF